MSVKYVLIFGIIGVLVGLFFSFIIGSTQGHCPVDEETGIEEEYDWLILF